MNIKSPSVHPSVVVLTVIMACCVLLAPMSAGAGAASADKSVQVTILQSKPVGISPDMLTVGCGATIVWVNRDPEPVKITFKTLIGEAGRAPVNFYADLLGHYESSKIPRGGAASLCIDTPGTYTYEVRRLVKKGASEPYEEICDGRIIVK